MSKFCNLLLFDLFSAFGGFIGKLLVEIMCLFQSTSKFQVWFQEPNFVVNISKQILAIILNCYE